MFCVVTSTFVFYMSKSTGKYSNSCKSTTGYIKSTFLKVTLVKSTTMSLKYLGLK